MVVGLYVKESSKVPLNKGLFALPDFASGSSQCFESFKISGTITMEGHSEVRAERHHDAGRVYAGAPGAHRRVLRQSDRPHLIETPPVR